MWLPKVYRRILIWRLRYISNRNFVFILAGIVGAIAGLAAVTLKTSVHWINHLLTGGFQLKTGDSYYVIYPTIGLLITYLIARYIFKEKRGNGVSSIIYAISKGSSRMKRRVMLSRLVTSIFTVGFGGSVGLEAPIVITGSAIGANIGSEAHLHYRQRTLMIGCGAAGAISAIFDSPIAGVIFAIEVILSEVNINKFIPLLIASVSGAIVSLILLQEESLFHFELTEAFAASDVPYYIGLGFFCGLVALYFTRTHYYIDHKMELIDSRIKRVLIAGAGLGVLIYLFPPMYGEGYNSIKTLITDGGASILNRSPFFDQESNPWFIVAFLAALIFIKAIAASLTIGSGGSGGIFAPSLFIGGVSGFLFARVMTLTGLGNVSTTNFALVGMCGVMTGVLHAPLTGIFLIAEITDGYTLFVPLMIVSAIAYITIYYFEPHSVYTKHLIEKGDLIQGNHDRQLLSLLKMKNMIDRDFVTIHHESTLGELVQVVKKCTRNIFPVINSEGNLIGIIYLDDIRQLMFNESKYPLVLVKTFMRPPKEIIQIDDTMLTVMAKFEKSNSWNLPVINDDIYVGFISKSTVFDAYRHRLIKQAKED